MADKHRHLRLVVLAHNLRAAGGLSVGKNVVSSLARVADHHEYFLLIPGGVGYEDIRKPTHSTTYYYHRMHGALGQMLFEAGTMPKLIRAYGPDLIWGLGNFALRNPPAKQAILLHKMHYIYDMSWQRKEVWRYRLVNRLGRRRLQRTLSGTQLVFCQTGTAVEQFRKAFRFRGRTAMMPNAVSEFTAQGETNEPPVFKTLGEKFVLFCLTRYCAHKNLEILAECFRRHGRQMQDVVILLTVQADQHPRARRFIASLDDPRLKGHLVNVGPVDQSELAAYLTWCDGLILPTLLESFSGTYVEAMQFQCPILTSDLDFAHDVCGSAARYFDPLDTASVRDTILHQKENPQERDILVAAGSERMRLFFRDWDSIVADAVQELESLVDDETSSSTSA